MSIVELFIKKPIAAIAISVALMLFGYLGFMQLPIRELPLVNSSVIKVDTRYPGASADTIESYISTPIQAAISGVKGIDYMVATNQLGKSDITIRLKDGVNVNNALTEVSARVSSVKWKLPKEAFSPQVERTLTLTPAIFYDYYSKTLPLALVCDYFHRVIEPQLETVKGVYGIFSHGDQQLAMRIWLNPKLMAAQHVTPLDVKQALLNNNVQIAAGRLHTSNEEYNIGAINAKLSTPAEYDDLIIKNEHDHLIRLKDIGYAEYGASSYRDLVVTKGSPAVIYGVVPNESADNIAVAAAMQKMVPEINKKLPAQIHSSLVWNVANISKEAIKTISDTAWLAVICVLIVIFLFLGSLRAILIPVIAIPFSLIAVCMLMAHLHYSVNSLTILAAVLAIGLVVDDAIVVVENTHRHIDEGLSPETAAIKSTKEIFLPVVAMTLTVAVVFIPIGFTGGLTGVLFHQFAFTIAGTIIFSGIFALMVAPMMCAKLLTSMQNQSVFAKVVDKFCELLTSSYKAILNQVIRLRYIMIIVVLLIFALGYYLFSQTNSQLIPDTEQGVILVIGKGPTNSNINATRKIALKLDKIFEKIKEFDNVNMVSGEPNYVNEIVGFLVMRSPKPGDRSEKELIKLVNEKMKNIKGMQLFAINRPPLLDITGVTWKVDFVLQTTGSYTPLYYAMQRLMEKASHYPGIVDVQSDLKMNKPQFNIEFLRHQAGAIGVTIKQVTDSLNFLLGRPIPQWFSMNGHSYPVVPQLIQKFRQSPQQIGQVKVRTKSGQLVELANVMKFKRVVAPQALNQFQQLRSATLTANVQDGYTLGQVLNFLEKNAKNIMTHKMKYDFSGTSREFVKTQGQLAFLFIFALIAIYLMLALQFNSFTDPFIILISVPMSLVGALIAMTLTHSTFNVYTEIGLIMLIGLISKHGILIVDFANHLLHEGHSKFDAAVKAASIRLRPVLMTSCAMIFGAFPLVYASGTGHESLNQIGIVIIGGLTIGSVLTLLVVPVFYTFFASKQ